MPWRRAPGGGRGRKRRRRGRPRERSRGEAERGAAARRQARPRPRGGGSVDDPVAVGPLLEHLLAVVLGNSLNHIGYLVLVVDCLDKILEVDDAFLEARLRRNLLRNATVHVVYA